MALEQPENGLEKENTPGVDNVPDANADGIVEGTYHHDANADGILKDSLEGLIDPTAPGFEREQLAAFQKAAEGTHDFIKDMTPTVRIQGDETDAPLNVAVAGDPTDPFDFTNAPGQSLIVLMRLYDVALGIYSSMEPEKAAALMEIHNNGSLFLGFPWLNITPEEDTPES